MLEKPMLAEVLVPFVHQFTGGKTANVETLVGDASTRRYHRVHVAGGSPASVLVMELPDDAFKSDEAGDANEADRVGGGELSSPQPVAGEDGRGEGGGPHPSPPMSKELPFLNMQRYLAGAGFPVPRVFGADMKKGLVALEDLGDRTLEMVVKEGSPQIRRRYYRRAMDQIVALQELGARNPDPTCVAFSRRFDESLLRWELAHFREWYLEAERGIALDAGASAEVEAAFDWIARELAAAPTTLVHRDFQSRNIMVTGDDALCVIDFQDALLGTYAYDLVALLRDSYVALAPDELDDAVTYFIGRAGIADRGAFRRLFVMQTLQRKLKDAGRFVFIDRVRKNPSFLRWIPTTISYVREALAVAPVELGRLRDVLGQQVSELAIS